ncbi:MAG: hypothetical protein PVJ21_03325 [Anaerolineales bacterium]|jgi:hypothetical protein
MNAFTALLMGVLPLTLFAWMGAKVRTETDEKQATERWLLFLLGLVTLLLAGMLVLILSSNQTPAAFFLILPSLWGSQTALFLFLFSRDRTWPHSHLSWSLSVIILGLLVWIGIAGEPFTVPLILVGSLLIALVWQAWIWVKHRALAAYFVLVLLLLLALWRADTAHPLFENPAWLSSAVQIVLTLAPGAAVIVAARIVEAGFRDEKSLSVLKISLTIISVLILLALIAYQTMLSSIWDVATDGLRGILLVGMTSLAAMASALILSWKLSGRRKLAATFFAVLVPVLMIGAERLGTLDRNGVWGTLPGQVTESRAEKINRGIQRFYAENDAYPQTLSELTPRYLLYIPVPYIIPGQDWCYESGVSYYRLGYVYREMFSLPASVRIHAAEGEPPDSTWECDEKAAKYQDIPGYGN